MAGGPRLLIETGQALFGERWQSELSRHLEVSDRTMRRWVAGDDVPRGGVWMDLLRLVVEKQAELDDVEQRLKLHGSNVG